MARKTKGAGVHSQVTYADLRVFTILKFAIRPQLPSPTNTKHSICLRMDLQGQRLRAEHCHNGLELNGLRGRPVAQRGSDIFSCKHFIHQHSLWQFCQTFIVSTTENLSVYLCVNICRYACVQNMYIFICTNVRECIYVFVCIFVSMCGGVRLCMCL